MSVVLKEEEKDVIDVDLLYEEKEEKDVIDVDLLCDANKEEQLDQQHVRDNSDLVLLGKSHRKKVKFPPPCCVVYTSSSEPAISEVLEDTVEAAFLHFETHEIKYKLKKSGLLVSERRLQFGRSTPVWVVPPGESDPAPGIVLHVRVRRSRQGGCEIVYSVQMDDEVKTVHHFVPSESVKYRSDGSNSKTQPIAARSEPKQLSGHSAGASSHQQEDERQHGAINDVNDTTTYSRDSGPARLKEGRGVDDSDLGPRSTATRRKRRRRGISRNNMMKPTTPRGVKRQKSRRDDDEKVQLCWMLPIWVDVDQVKAHFSSAKRIDLEESTKCRLSLRGGAVEANPPRPARLYVEIEGRRGAIDYAIERLEDMLLDDSFANRDMRCILLHDIARDNSMYHKSGPVVYQRSGLHNGEEWRWTTCQDLPRDWDLDQGKAVMVGPSGRGISLIRGGTPCDIRICGSPRPCVIVYGKNLDEVKDCREGVLRRISWAKRKYDLSVV